MTISESQPLNRRRSAPSPRAGGGGRPWLYPVLLAILAIAVFALTDLPPRPEVTEGQSSTEFAPALDGRGKWRGYMD